MEKIYKNKNVVVTGHTGFKGSWLVAWLKQMGASVTGIAGPGGGSPDKPVGLVHFSCQWRGKPAVHDHHIFIGDRDSVRKKSSQNLLTMIYNELK